MLVYRFKINFEEQDGFSRELDLLSGQYFEDFHQAITQNLGLDPGMLSSFFICDYKFRKKQEIPLVNVQVAPADEDAIPVPLMSESRLSSFIDDPHQKLLYIYDYLNKWTFYIELIKILPADKNKDYPRINRMEGEVPRELTATPKEIPVVEKPDDFIIPEAEEGYDPEDLAGLEGENEFFENDKDVPFGNIDEEL